MADKLPLVTARQVIAVVERIGFQRIRQSGSHATFRHPDGRWTIVSVHPGKTIPRGTLLSPSQFSTATGPPKNIHTRTLA
jgi:predicted RNA binding protein YcfA (HicA-like mRNA interferase family)